MSDEQPGFEMEFTADTKGLDSVKNSLKGTTDAVLDVAKGADSVTSKFGEVDKAAARAAKQQDKLNAAFERYADLQSKFQKSSRNNLRLGPDGTTSGDVLSAPIVNRPASPTQVANQVRAAENAKASRIAFQEQTKFNRALKQTEATAAKIAMLEKQAASERGRSASYVGKANAAERAGDAAKVAEYNQKSEAALKAAVGSEKQITAEKQKQRREQEQAGKNAVATAMKGQSNPLAAQSAGISAGLAAGLDGQQISAAIRQTADEAQRAAGKYANARYAMLGVAQTFTVLSAAIYASQYAFLKVAGDFEVGFVQIQRTAEMSTNEVAGFKEEFTGLLQTMATPTSDLFNIGSLAGQLNVAAEDIDRFTASTAKFSATTNVTAESAATAYGRLDTLLPDVLGNYDALGSSILKVGINSVATESEIVSTTNQIAAAGAQAGFAASDVIGLAAAYASLGVAPEASRGTTIRVFSEISKAVNAGGQDLAGFARLARTSAEQFQASWGRDSAGAFVDVLKGLQTEGAGAEVSIRNLGITAVRDVNALLRLSQNVELVEQSMIDAGNGFRDTGLLTDQYGMIADTLNGKLQTMANSFEVLMATMGSSGFTPIKALVDMVTDLLVVLNEVAQSPVGQFFSGLAGLMSIVVATGLALAAGAAVMTASYFGLRQAIAGAQNFLTLWNLEARIASAEAGKLATGFTLVQGAATKAGLGVNFFSRALVSTGVGALLVGLGLLVNEFVQVGIAADTALTPRGEGLKNALEADYKALQAFNAALADGTATAAEAPTIYGRVEGQMTSTSTATADWALALDQATNSNGELAAAQAETTERVNDYTWAIGENTRMQMLNDIASDESVIALYKQGDALKALGVDMAEYIRLRSSGDTEGALRWITESTKELGAMLLAQKDLAGNDLTSDQIAQYYALYEQFKDLREATEIYGDELGNAADKGQAFRGVAQAMGIDLGDLEDGALDAAGALDELTLSQQHLGAEGLGNLQATEVFAQMASDTRDFAQGMIDANNSINVLSSDGSANLANLMTAVDSSIAAGKTMGLTAQQSVSVLFETLKAQGIDTARLLAQLANMKINIPGFNDNGAYRASYATKAQAEAGKELLTVMNQIPKVTPKVSAGQKSVGDSAKKMAEEQRKAAKAIEDAQQTLEEYANDLNSVFNRSFGLQFDVEVSEDKLTGMWQAMQDSIADARKDAASALKDIADAQRDIRDAVAETNQQVREYRAEMNVLKADREILKIWLAVAEQYKDTTRAAQLRAQIAEKDVQIAGKAKDIADEQVKGDKNVASSREDILKANEALRKANEALDRSLKGNTASAISNRASLRDLASEYQTLITRYASSGMSQQDLARKTEELRQRFIQQATQLGYNRAEVDRYANNFVHLTNIINKVPRNIAISVSAGTDAADIALREFQRRNQNGNGASRPIDVPVRVGGGSGGLGPVSTALNNDLDLSRIIALQKARQIADAINEELMNNIGAQAGGSVDSHINRLRLRSLATIRGYSQGGYTGNIGRKNVAGVVHGNEYVMDAQSTARIGVSNLDAMRAGKPIGNPVSMGRQSQSGPSAMILELSPTDRALIAANKNVTVVLGTDAVGRAANAANLSFANQGSN